MPFDAAAREGDAEAQHLLDLVKSREHMLAQQLARTEAIRTAQE